MPNKEPSNISRRTFVRHGGLAAGGMMLGSTPPSAGAAEPGHFPSTGPSEIPPAKPNGPPRRVLGRTNVPVTTMTLGCAPCGFAKGCLPPEIGQIVNEALDLGVTAVDTAPLYKKSEEGVGLGLGSRRKEVFLSTKVWADTIEEAEKSLANSFKMLKTDYIDLLYFHSLGNRKVDGAMDPDGVFTWLLKQKKAGKCRFVGISAHNAPARCLPFLKTGEVDTLLTVINFVDHHTYHFEEKVLPVCRKRNVGVVCMKVFGGSRKGSGGYSNPKAPPQMDESLLESAVRYSLGVLGVTTLDLGVHNKEQVRKNVEFVKNYRPLSPEETEKLTTLGQKLAGDWGEHFGPVKIGA